MRARAPPPPPGSVGSPGKRAACRPDDRSGKGPAPAGRGAARAAGTRRRWPPSRRAAARGDRPPDRPRPGSPWPVPAVIRAVRLRPVRTRGRRTRPTRCPATTPAPRRSTPPPGRSPSPLPSVDPRRPTAQTAPRRAGPQPPTGGSRADVSRPPGRRPRRAPGREWLGARRRTSARCSSPALAARPPTARRQADRPTPPGWR